MDTFALSLVPTLLAARDTTDRLLRHLSQQLFAALNIPCGEQGNVEFRYLDRFWHLQVHPPCKGVRKAERILVCIKDTLNSEELEDGVGVDDRGVVINGYRVFRMADGTIDLLVLDASLEQEEPKGLPIRKPRKEKPT